MSLVSIEWHTLHPRYIDRDSNVVDLGANHGRFSRQVIERFGCRCFAVEPSPEVFRAIPSSERLQKFNLAISTTTGPLRFFVRESSLASSLDARPAEHSSKEVTVDVCTLESFARSINLPRIDLLKCDIEGAEIDMFDACSDEFLARIAQISIEFHDFCGITPKVEVQRILARFRRLGFHAIRMSRVGHQDTILINRNLCPISRLELAYLRWIHRNWLGFLRVAGRLQTRWTARA